jgi:hypothetical protein
MKQMMSKYQASLTMEVCHKKNMIINRLCWLAKMEKTNLINSLKKQSRK